MNAATHSARAWTIAALVLVACGLVLRLIHPSYVAFGGEQVESIALAWKSWREGGADHGLHVSVGIDMPPFYLWLLSLPVAFTRDPVRVTQFVMLLNVAGLAGLFLLVRARRSVTEAWIVTALVATAPWSIVFARKIWAQDVLFPFLVAFYAVFLSALDRPAAWKTWIGLLLLGVVMQIYPSAWFLLPAIVATAWIARLRTSVRDVAIGCGLVLLLWWPYIRYQLAVDFDDWRYLYAMKYGHSASTALHVTSGTGQGRGWMSHMLGSWQRSGGSGLDELLGPAAFSDWQKGPITRAATLVGDAFVCVGAVVTVFGLFVLARGVRARVTRASVPAPSPTLVLCAAILVCVPIEYAFVHAVPISHYHIVVQPAIAILAVAGAHEIARARGPRAGWILHGALLVFAFVFAVQSASLQRRLVEHPGTILGGNGPIYAGARAALDDELFVALDDVVSGDERRKAEDALSSALFASSSDVLFTYAGVTGVPALQPVGAMLLEPGPEGTRATVQIPPALVDLPEFAAPDHGRVVVRIDISSPIETYQTLFFQTEQHREYKRTQKVVRKLPRGRSSCYVVLPAAGLRGPLRLWLGPTRSTIHSIEVRAVESES